MLDGDPPVMLLYTVCQTGTIGTTLKKPSAKSLKPKPAAASNGVARGSASPSRPSAKPASDEPLFTPAAPAAVTLNQLDSHLWEAANILRGSPLDRTDWKSYILPLLFFKRICDVWDEETAEATATYGGSEFADFPEAHRFQVPDGCHWSDVRAKASNVGTALQNAMRGIEKANQKHLYGVFGDAQWTNKDRLPDSLLKDLIEHFSSLTLSNATVKNDVLGDAYEILIKRFADSTNKKAGEFYTPRSVVRLMASILNPKPGETVYDPACGTAGMLLAAVEHVRHHGGDPRTFFGKLYGQEKNLTTSAVARMNLLLHGLEDFEIQRGDTLRNPVFLDPSGSLATFDCVIANPPFSLEKWGEDKWASDPFGRNFAGLPPTSSGDYAWVQHMVCSMAKPKGRLAVVLPQGALFRKAAEGDIRHKLLQMDLFEAVIGLSPNLFYGTGLAACIVIMRLRKPTARKRNVLFIDASTLMKKGRAQNFLEPEHVKQIHDWYQGYADVENYARVATLDEIEKEGWTLNISRYVTPKATEEIPPLPEAVAAFKAALANCRDAETAMEKAMSEGGWLK
jgi:type I restriction enzyme M protein